MTGPSAEKAAPAGSRPPSRVVACTGDGGVRVERRPRPEPAPGELLLRLSCCGICGTDLFKLRFGTAPEGTVLGHELVGTVEAAGDGVEGFAPGDRVVSPHHVACGDCALCRRGAETLCPTFREDQLEPGGFSDFVRVRRRAVAHAARRVPDGVADEAAAFLEPAACVVRGIDRSGLAGAARAAGGACSAAILGAGSMGLLHLLTLRALFPEIRILVAEPEAERLELARRLGADAAAGGDPAEVADAAAALGLAGGFDAVFDTAGRGDLFGPALALAGEGGTLVLFAHARPSERAGFELNPFFKAERRVVATYSGSLREQETAWRLIVSGRLDPSPLVTHRLPFERFAEGVDLVSRRLALKVLVVP